MTHMSPDQIAAKVLVEHSIRPDWRRTGEQIHSLIVEAVEMDRAQRTDPRPADLVVTDTLREQYDLEGDAEEITQQILDALDGMTAHDLVDVMQTLVRYARQEV